MWSSEAPAFRLPFCRYFLIWSVFPFIWLLDWTLGKISEWWSSTIFARMSQDFHDQVLEKRAFFFSVSTCCGLKLASAFSRISLGINKHKTTSQSSFIDIDFSKLNKHLVDWKYFIPDILKIFWLQPKEINSFMLSPLRMLSYATGLCRVQALRGDRLGFAPHLFHLLLVTLDFAY